mgnify:CR=1 FL=1
MFRFIGNLKGKIKKPNVVIIFSNEKKSIRVKKKKNFFLNTEIVTLSVDEVAMADDLAGLGSICNISTSGSFIRTAIKL